MSLKVGYSAAIASTLSFAVLPILLALLIERGYSFGQVMLLRFGLSFVVILSTSLLIRLIWNQRMVIVLRPNHFITATAFFFTALFITISLKYIQPALANVIFFTFPIFVLLTDVLRRKTSFNFLLFLAVLMLFGGIVLLNAPQGQLRLELGALWSLASALSFTIYLLVSDADTAAGINTTLSTLLLCTMLSLGLVLIDHAPWPAFRGTDVVLGITLAIFPTSLAIFLLNYALRSLSTSTLSIVSATEPAFVLILSLVLGQAHIGTAKFVAFGLIFGAVILASVYEFKGGKG